MNEASSSSPRTLQLRRPFGRSLGIAALFLILYLVLAELLIRAVPVHAVLGAPGLGSEHRQFEQQWHRLENYVAHHGRIDCIMVGDSTVMSDFSPTTFADSYRQQTGEELACYNFGVGAFTVVGFSTLAEILIREYSPRLLIVGVEALNFTVPGDEQGDADLSRVTWAQYQLGEFTLEGWLYDHTYLYRYLGVMGQLVTFEIDYREIVQSAAEERRVHEDGYSPLEGAGPFNVSELPNPELNHPYIEHYFAALSPFQLLPENLEALDKIMTLSNTGTRVILVEMPVTETFHTFFGNDEQDYRMFIDMISSKAATQDVSFWRMDNLQPLPRHAWFNYNHLNSAGAPVFSRWLGTTLGQERVSGGS